MKGFLVNFLKCSLPIFAAGFFCCSFVFASGPSFVFSWASSSDAPDWFLGKKMPSSNSSVVASFELISQNKSDFGKIVNLKNSEVRWYVNGKFIFSGNGLQKIEVPKSVLVSGYNDIRASVNFYNSDIGTSGFVDGFFSFPVLEPEIVINYQNFERKIDKNGSVFLRAIPFFFDGASGVSVNWKVDGNKVNLSGGDPFELVVNLGKNISKSFKVEVLGQDQTGESASKSIMFDVL